MSTPEQYADNLATLALRLVGAVHDEGPNAVRGALVACRCLTPPRGIDPDDALIVLLAAMVDPDKRRSELLGWLTPRDGHPVGLIPKKTGDYRCNPLAVEMAISGALPARSLNPVEAREAVMVLKRRGWSPDSIALHLDTDERHITKLLATRAPGSRGQKGAAA